MQFNEYHIPFITFCVELLAISIDVNIIEYIFIPHTARLHNQLTYKSRHWDYIGAIAPYADRGNCAVVLALSSGVG